MKKSLFIVLFVLFFVQNAFSKPLVVTSTYILSALTKQIGQNKIDTQFIVPENANPHFFNPTPKDVQELSKANLFIGVGYGFEFWFNKVKNNIKGNILMLSDYYTNPIGKKVLKGQTIANPHIWLDMNFVKNTAVFEIAKHLCKIDSKDCQFFMQNAKHLSQQISHIQTNYENLFKNKNICIIEVDPAFDYFLESFGQKPCAKMLEEGSGELSIGNFKLLENCKCKKGIVIYAFRSKQAQAIAKEKHYKPVYLSPLGNSKNNNQDSYTKLLKYNLEELKRAIND
ncbi:metal ABC transporter substrate-binding protein [Desulfurella sp.]|uniref:metal ABC transporter substrate-binding protein n=1 Tax=Desulfurella sp. TaxID=1962857 RepID=UPI0025C6055E|nr:metal ABC transporter substrate-binding protein [Desulfurella sp.]